MPEGLKRQRLKSFFSRSAKPVKAPDKSAALLTETNSVSAEVKPDENSASETSEKPADFGLWPLAKDWSVPSGQYEVDIIAIHGLNGHRLKTWTHDNGTLWLRDLLPKTLPGCRAP